MGVIWYVVRTFYALGLMVAAPLFFIVAADAGRDVEVSVPVLIGCIIYFVLGYIVFKVVPGWLEARLRTRVERHKARGFTPQWEVVSVIYNRYVGFDPKARKALYVNMDDGMETVVDFDNVNGWELEIDRSKPALLKVLTRMPALPVIGLRIDRRKSNEWKANLGTIFG